MDVTLDQLRAIDPRAPAAELPLLNAAMAEGGIVAPIEQGAFLAQVGYETDGFRAFTERWGPTADQTRYERPAGAELVDGPHKPLWQRLGNTEPGDGRRFSGHGGIQLTGRANHEACGKALGLDLVGRPELAATPENRYRVAVWYWRTHGCSAPALDGDVVGVTRIVNGPGMNGLAERKTMTWRAWTALGVAQVCS